MMTLPRGFADFYSMFAIGILGFWVLVHIIFAIAVYIDASQKKTQLVGPLLWALVTLLGGVLFVGIYWFVNRFSIKVDANELKELIEQTNRAKASQKVDEKLNSFKNRFK